MYMMFRKSAKPTLPDTYANTPRVAPMMADVPVARPSIPSVMFAPFDTAVMMRITIGMNTIHAYFL
jgi:hypothetical protein